MSVSKVNFTGGAVNPIASVATVYREAGKYKEAKELQKELLTLMPKPVQALNKLSKCVGEVPNILINAIGTAIVAPIFIKYNFLSKTDEDTRTYSALRQPISAVLAVLIQAGVVIPVNSLLDNASNKNNGYFSHMKYDKSCFQDLDYLKSSIKKANPGMSKSEIAKLAEHQQLEQLQTLIDNAKQSHKIEYISNGELRTLPEKEYKQLLKQTTDDLLKHVDTNLARYDGEKFDNQFKRGEFLRTNAQDVKKVLKEIETKANTAKSEAELSTWFKLKNKAMKKEEVPQELIDIVNEISDRANIKTIKEKVKDVEFKCAEYTKCESKQEVLNKTFEHIEIKKNAMLEEKSIIDKMRKVIFSDGPVSKVFEEAKHLKESDFVYELALKHTKNVASNLKGYKQIAGILVGLVTLPISCYMLNWAYPRLMDTFFPKLSKSKKAANKDSFIKAAGTQPVAAVKAEDKTAKEVQS